MASNNSRDEKRPEAPGQGDRSKRQEPQRRAGIGKAAIVLTILCVVLLLIGGLPRMKHSRALAQDARETRNAPTPVDVFHPQQAPSAPLLLPGNTLAVNDTVIGARASGYVKQWYADIGDHVHAGQLLAVLEAPDLDVQVAQARSDTARSIAAVRQAQADVANKASLVAQGQSNVKQAEATREQARAQLATARSNLATAEENVGIKQAALKQAQAQLDLASVTLARYKTLLQYGYVALQDVDQSQANYDTEVAAVHSAESDLKGAQAQVTANQATVASYEKSVNAAAQTVEANRSAVHAAVANQRESEANVTASRFAVSSSTANEEHAAVLARYERITAPFDGVITARNIDVGNLIGSGNGSGSTPAAPPATSTSSSTGSGSTASTLTSSSTVGSASSATPSPSTAPGTGLYGIARIDTLRVLVSVPETYAPEIGIGMPAQITFREYPGSVFHGQVSRRAGAVDASSRMLLTEIRLPNSTGKLLPGLYAQVRFDLPQISQAVRVPATSIIFDSQGSRAVMVTPQNTLHFVPVVISKDLGNAEEIKQGLTTNSVVVTNPTDDMYEGQSVKAVWPPPPGTPPPGGKAPAKK